MQILFKNENEWPAEGRRKNSSIFWLSFKANLTKILNLDSTDLGTEICVSSLRNFMELFETQFYWKQFQKLLSGNPGSQKMYIITRASKKKRIKYGSE